MAEINLVAAFSTVPGGEAEAIKQLLTDTIQQIAQDDGTFKKAKIVFTESDERCGLTAELDGVKKEGVPLSLDLEQLRAVGGRQDLRRCPSAAEGGASPRLQEGSGPVDPTRIRV
jgi:hypothetical protein